jgi:hypothetical protein
MNNRMTHRVSVRTVSAAMFAAVTLGLAACAADAGPASPGNVGPSSSADLPSSTDLPSRTERASRSDQPSSAGPSSKVDRSSSVERSRTAPPIYSPEPSEAANPVPDLLAGYRFGSTTATGRKLVAGKPLTIVFPKSGAPDVGGPGVSLNAGCNGMGGSPVFDGPRLSVPQILSTQMACSDPDGGNAVMEQENWYDKWLTAGVTWRLDGTDLVLSGQGVSVTFVRQGSAEQTTSPPTGDPDRPTGTGVSHPSVPDRHPPITASTITPVAPRSPVPGATAPSRSVRPGDSIPEVPGPDDGSALGGLTGHTFTMTGTFTDTGGANLMTKGLDFRLTFTADGAAATGDCGRLVYTAVKFAPADKGLPSAGSTIRMGTPTGPNCIVGKDPSGPPEGDLLVIRKGNTLTLSTGAVGWTFTEK